MKHVTELLEKAYADAMYDGLFETAGLIAAALETMQFEKKAGRGSEEDAKMSGNIIRFPTANRK